MIGFKKPPIRIVLSLFFISIILILLIYVDSVLNKPAPIEEISIKKNFNNSLPMIENALFHEVKKGDSLSVIFEEKEIPLNTAYRIFNFDNPKSLERITNIFFNQRRKKIKNQFKVLFNNNTEIAENLGIDLNCRPQNLEPEIYYSLAHELEKLRK